MSSEKFIRILLVDDDADDQLLFTSAVAEMGNQLNCDCVSGTLEALTYLEHADPLPDFIFLDLNMPGYDGKRCLKQLKSSERLQAIPVIIYSTFISDDDGVEMKRLGAELLVTKPGDFNSLQLAILQSIECVRQVPK